ncbi:kinase-like protein [Punctularia strigosozonata HHB-11173 SS5]|uniref:Kinase-like protein n=1 Tax=Punctularia strigosozonata (strain HHB-11173) TaxID=741275 RepID=R7S306_PUNST|nr:kinase-like protein [Punctularia strigosozonata HHB-11173 SS5]EIN04613.1 kinase-like protein [Punctularia strigosozonata HHB-11173 SS5]
MDSETGNTTHKYAGPALLRQLQAKIYHVDSSLAEPNLWGNALRLYQRVASELDRYPRALVLNDVETDLANPIFDGHYADVFKGHSADGDVAVKRFRLAGTSKQNLDFSKALLAEALVWRHLDHANILPFLGLMTSSEQDEHHAELSLLCMVTPWAQNGNLRRYLDATEGISLSEKHSLILGIAEGLAYLHDAGIIHGDLRGVNIMVDANSCPRLGDYGLSQLVEAWPVLASRKKAEGPTRWTAPELLSPEHFDRESSEPTYASDVYAFACVCYEVYTSQSPFHALKREASVIFRVLDSKRPEFTVEDCAGGLPPQAMQELIRRSWDQMPDNRPQIHEVLRRLKQ